MTFTMISCLFLTRFSSDIHSFAFGHIVVDDDLVESGFGQFAATFVYEFAQGFHIVSVRV